MRDSEIKTLSITKGALFVSRRKTSRSEQLSAAKACAEGYIGSAEAARRLKIDESTVREWVEQYRAHGDAAFTETAKNRSYSNGLEKGDKFKYLFDFGDEWRFQCRVMQELEEKTKSFRVIKAVGDPPAQYPGWDDEEL